jgi:hypothetical protein
MIRFPLLCALLAGCLMLAAPAAVRAQQDYQFTQFAFNKLALNPAYGGTDNLISLTSLYRRHWSGLEGAPATRRFFTTGSGWGCWCTTIGLA